MKISYQLLLSLLLCLVSASCQSHLSRYVTVYDYQKKLIKAKVVFQTSDWNGVLGTLNNGFAVVDTSINGSVNVKIPNHKEVTVGVRGLSDNLNPSAKIRFKGEGDLEIYKALDYIIPNTMATKSELSGYHILISRDPKKSWRDFTPE